MKSPICGLESLKINCTDVYILVNKLENSQSANVLEGIQQRVKENTICQISKKCMGMHEYMCVCAHFYFSGNSAALGGPAGLH